MTVSVPDDLLTEQSTLFKISVSSRCHFITGPQCLAASPERWPTRSGRLILWTRCFAGHCQTKRLAEALQGQAAGTASEEKERDRKREGKRGGGGFQLAGLNTTQIMLTHTLSYTPSVVLYSGRSCLPECARDVIHTLICFISSRRFSHVVTDIFCVQVCKLVATTSRLVQVLCSSLLWPRNLNRSSLSKKPARCMWDSFGQLIFRVVFFFFFLFGEKPKPPVWESGAEREVCRLQLQAL